MMKWTKKKQEKNEIVEKQPAQLVQEENKAIAELNKMVKRADFADSAKLMLTRTMEDVDKEPFPEELVADRLLREVIKKIRKTGDAGELAKFIDIAYGKEVEKRITASANMSINDILENM